MWLFEFGVADTNSEAFTFLRGLKTSLRLLPDSAYNRGMKRKSLAIAAVVLASLSLRLFADDATVNRRKAETITKADRLFGQRYTAAEGTPLRLYDRQTETGPPDALIYWHGSSYVIELIFGADGAVARLQLFPEALLHSDTWSDVPSGVELSRAEMEWLIASANILQPLGKAREITEAPNRCFVSGPNYYCEDRYELASVSHYHQQPGGKELALRDIAVLYRQRVGGFVEDMRVEGNQRQFRVGGQWYHAEEPGVDIFEKAQIGSVVSLVTYGCTANEKACIAVPEQSKAVATQQ